MANDFDKELNQVIGKIAFKVASEIKKEAPVNTGRFRNSILAVKQGNTWVVGSNVDYAEFIEFGIKPHTITPKNKKALYWGGAKHPVKKVEHPGTEGKFLFTKAQFNAERILKEELSKL